MKPEKIALQVRIEESIYKNLKIIAKMEMRSLNAQLEYFLRNANDRYINSAPKKFKEMEEKYSEGEADEADE